MNILLGLAVYLAVSLVASVLIGTMLKAGSLVPAARAAVPARVRKPAAGVVEAA